MILPVIKWHVILKHALKMIFDKRLLSHEGFFNELSNRGFTLNTTMVEQLLDLNPGYFRMNRDMPEVTLVIR